MINLSKSRKFYAISISLAYATLEFVSLLLIQNENPSAGFVLSFLTIGIFIVAFEISRKRTISAGEAVAGLLNSSRDSYFYGYYEILVIPIIVRNVVNAVLLRRSLQIDSVEDSVVVASSLLGAMGLIYAMLRLVRFPQP